MDKCRNTVSRIGGVVLAHLGFDPLHHARIGAALASGLENALGVSQVVDVFRALTTAAVALANAPKIVMVRTVARHSRARKGTPLHTAVHQT